MDVARSAVAEANDVGRRHALLAELAALTVAGVLHAGAVWARAEGWLPRADLMLGGFDAALPIALLVAAALVRWSGRREAALVVALLILPFAVRPGALVLLFLAMSGVWVVSRLSWRVAPRLGLSAVVLGALVGVRCGWAGPWLAAGVRINFGVELFLWSLVLLRSWLLQMERDSLEARQRSYPAFLGTVGLFALGGAVHGAPIPHATLYAPRRPERSVALSWSAVGLLALALAYQVLVKLASQRLGDPVQALKPAAARDALDAYLTGQTPGTLWLALGLYWPFKYAAIAARLFFLVANLRLLGFDLPSGFRQPFLSRNFVDLWRNWNHYVRDAAMVLFFFPSMGALRRRLPASMVQPAAVLVSFAALIVLDTVIRPAFELPIVVPRGSFVVQGLRLALTGSITAVTVWWTTRKGRHRQTPSPWIRLAATVSTLMAAAGISTAAAVLSAGLSGSQLVVLSRFLLAGG